MGTKTRTRIRTSLAASAVVGAAVAAALLPSAAVAADAAPLASQTHTDSRAAGAAMLGGWVGGGILLLGTGVLVASSSVRRTARGETLNVEGELAEA